MYLHKLVWLALENLAQRPLRTLFLVLTVGIGAGATMFLLAFHRGLDGAIRDNLLKGLPDKSLEVRPEGLAENAAQSQLSSLLTLGQTQTETKGIPVELVERIRDLHAAGVTREPVEVKTRPLLPFTVRIQPDFDRMEGVMSLLNLAISQRERSRIGGPVMFHGIDGSRAESELPVEITLEADEVPIFLAREWLKGADNFSQLRERDMSSRREKNMKRLAEIADTLFFKKGATGVPVFLLLSKGGKRKVVQGRVVGFCNEATIHGLSVDAGHIEQWAEWNNEAREEPLPLTYNAVTVVTNSTDDMLAAAEELAKMEGLEVSGRLVTARRLSNLRDMLPMATLIIGVILFFLAAGGIVVGLSLSVAEQIKRIGILRSVGAKQLDILFLFICEALIVGCLGVLLGALLSHAGISVVDPVIKETIPGVADIRTMFLPSERLNVLVGVAGVLVALLSGLVPAFTATLIRPSEVLKV